MSIRSADMVELLLVAGVDPALNIVEDIGWGCVHYLEVSPFEIEPGGRPDFPVASLQPFALD